MSGWQALAMATRDAAEGTLTERAHRTYCEAVGFGFEGHIGLWTDLVRGTVPPRRTRRAVKTEDNLDEAMVASDDVELTETTAAPLETKETTSVEQEIEDWLSS